MLLVNQAAGSEQYAKVRLFTWFYEEIELAEDDEIYNVNDEKMKEDAADETERVLCLCVGAGGQGWPCKGWSSIQCCCCIQTSGSAVSNMLIY
jgi:hypothetical protein